MFWIELFEVVEDITKISSSEESVVVESGSEVSRSTAMGSTWTGVRGMRGALGMG